LPGADIFNNMNNNKKELKNVSTKNDDSHKSEKIKISNDNYNNSQNSQQQQQQQLINNYDNSSVEKESRNFYVIGVISAAVGDLK
jgi:uncharacterized membrane protein